VEWSRVSSQLELGTIAAGVGLEDSETLFVTAGVSIRKSVNGGQSWQLQNHPPALLYYDIDRAAGANSSLLFAGGQSLGIGGGATFSLDDGQTWLPVARDHQTWYSQDVVVADENTFYGIGTYAHQVGQYHWGVMRSADRGESMQYFDCDCLTNARYGAFPSPDVWYITAGTWYDVPAGESLSGFHGNVLSLTPHLDLVVDGENVQARMNPDRRLFYYRVVSKTVDGGRSFTRIIEDWASHCYPNQISCVTDNDCWYVCDGDVDSWIYHTNDGGRNWEEQYNGESHLMALYMLNSQEGWAAGSDKIKRIFFHTIDGGNLWIRTQETIAGFVTTLEMESNQNGYSTGFGARMGGEVWRYQ